MTETIFALASGAGRSAIAVIRVSGPRAGAALMALAGTLPSPRTAALRRLCDPTTGTVLDQALVLWFPGPSSATGEDVAELHCHGGRAVIAGVLVALGSRPDCRLAEPGEFTRRAFLNGRMKLAEVEGLADLIEAETEAQRRQALRQLEGALGIWVRRQRDTLLQALALAESAIDFSDEGDVAGDFAREVHVLASTLLRAVRDQLGQGKVASRIRDGLVVAIAGPPNAGKSTLMNALARRDVAIVSPLPGTTRDPLEVQLDLDGFLVHLIDTAGLRSSEDPIEREGIARARARSRGADLVLWLADARDPCPPDPGLADAAVWLVATKIDLAPGPLPSGFHHAIAAPSGDGLPALIASLKALAGEAGANGGGVVTRERHRVALVAADRGLAAIVDGGDALGLEVAAEQLRFVASRLDSLIGRIETEEVLGSIFARFCIGK